MVKAVRMHHLPSGVRALHFQDTEIQQPGREEVEVRHTAILATTLDIKLGEEWADEDPDRLPFIPGFSAAGVITELGSGVLSHQIGQRVAYCSFPQRTSYRHAMHVYSSLSDAPLGSYCEARIVPVSHLVPLPDYVSDQIGAATLFLGLIARMLVKKAVTLEKEQKVLVHPAAGELGSLVCQWARHVGAFVIGTIGPTNDAKEEAEACGCNLSVVYEDSPDFAREVRDLSGNDGVTVVYDLMGKGTLKNCLDCLALKGSYVTLATESGEDNYLDLEEVAGNKGSLIRADIRDYVSSHKEFTEGAMELFEMLKSGQLMSSTTKQYPLELAAQAHEELASRKSPLGSCILVPPIPDPRNVPDAS